MSILIIYKIVILLCYNVLFEFTFLIYIHKIIFRTATRWRAHDVTRILDIIDSIITSIVNICIILIQRFGSEMYRRACTMKGRDRRNDERQGT